MAVNPGSLAALVLSLASQAEPDAILAGFIARVNEFFPGLDIRLSLSPPPRSPCEELSGGRRTFGWLVFGHSFANLSTDDKTTLRQTAHLLGLAMEAASPPAVQPNLPEDQEDNRSSLAVTGTDDGLFDWNLVSNQVYYSNRWAEILGLQPNEMHPDPEEWMQRVHPEDAPHLQADLAAHLDGRSPQLNNEHRMLNADKQYRWVRVRARVLRDEYGSTIRLVGTMMPTHEQHLLEERLRHDALHHPLTGLPNRVYFLDQLRRSIERTKRHDQYQSGLVVIDLDRFQVINESLGYPKGDEILVTVAQRIESCMRTEDLIAHFDGDNFAILLENIHGAHDAIRVANRLQKEISRPFQVNGQEVFVTASLGIAMINIHYDHPQDLLRDAEAALSRAKAEGRGHYQIFDKDLHARSLSVLRMEAELRRAVERKEFRVYYMPIISLKSGKITGMEALIRWEHPQRGIILPGEFLPLAEESGLMVQIGEQVLQTACARAQEWHTAGYSGLNLAVNLSAHQFMDPNLVDRVKTALKQSSFSSNSLILEISETAAASEVEMNEAAFRGLHKMGVQIFVDNFGSTYSSLSYLKRFCVSGIKIDPSFIRELDKNPDDVSIVSAIVSMARILNLHVVASGVTQDSQLNYLHTRQVDEVQGFLFSKPVSAEKASHLLDVRRNLLHSREEETGNGS